MLTSNRNKIFLLILISIIIFSAWELGLERIYEKTLVGITNTTLPVLKKDTRIELEEIPNKDTYQFRVYTRVHGRFGNYPQETGGLMEPFVIVLSWQLFLFFLLHYKTALKLLVINLIAFILIQVIFLVLLTGYYNSAIQQFLFDMMLDNFYIVALILVIKDNILHPAFRKIRQS
jgi:hypothetical protein